MAARASTTAPSLCRGLTRQQLELRLVDDVFGDPALYVDSGDERRALLLDLGDRRALPPCKLLRIAQIFVTHRHMDHFAGFDHLLRVALGRQPTLALHGGPGFVAQVAHRSPSTAFALWDGWLVPRRPLETHCCRSDSAGKCQRAPTPDLGLLVGRLSAVPRSLTFGGGASQQCWRPGDPVTR
jgi:hypothetical protein